MNAINDLSDEKPRRSAAEAAMAAENSALSAPVLELRVEIETLEAQASLFDLLEHTNGLLHG